MRRPGCLLARSHCCLAAYVPQPTIFPRSHPPRFQVWVLSNSLAFKENNQSGRGKVTSKFSVSPCAARNYPMSAADHRHIVSHLRTPLFGHKSCSNRHGDCMRKDFASGQLEVTCDLFSFPDFAAVPARCKPYPTTLTSREGVEPELRISLALMDLIPSSIILFGWRYLKLKTKKRTDRFLLLLVQYYIDC